MDLLLFIGAGILAGFALSRLAHRVNLPSVVGYIVAGMVIGPSILGFYHESMVYRMDSLSDLALALVAFIIGSQLRWKEMAKVGKKVFGILLAESLGAFIFVLGGMWLITGDPVMALVFAAMAPATAPAGTVAVLQEARAKGVFTNTVLAVVGLDDGLAIIVYAFSIAVAKIILKSRLGIKASLNIKHLIVLPFVDIFGAIFLGLFLGFILAYFVKKLRNRDHVLILNIGMLLTCTGISNHFHFSLILANLTLGTFIANTYPRASLRSLQTIQGVVPPIFVIFFVMAGAHLNLSLLGAMGVVGLIYFVMRIAGKITGAWFGCRITKAPAVLKKYLGMALLSQAGVAVGLAIIIQKELRVMGPEAETIGMLVINTIAATTLMFEILGPICTRIAVNKSGEANQAPSVSRSSG